MNINEFLKEGLILDTVTKEKMLEESVDKQKREFMKKFGKYAATAPVGMYLLMGPGASKAQASGTSCSFEGHVDVQGFQGQTCEIIDYEASGSSDHCTVDVKTIWGDHRTLEIYNKDYIKVYNGETGAYQGKIKVSTVVTKKDKIGYKYLYEVLENLNII